MNYFRLSKYNPLYRVDGIYQREEWTSIYDVGTVYNGAKLTMPEYERVETEYIDFVVDVIESSSIKEVKIAYIEPGKIA